MERSRHSVRPASQSPHVNPVRTRAFWLTPDRAATSPRTSSSLFCELQTLNLPFAPERLFSRTVVLGVDDLNRSPLGCVTASPPFIVMSLAGREV